MSLKLNTRQVNDVTVVDVSGRLTLGEGSSAMREAVRDLITDGHRKVLLNLAEASYIDSSGFGELVHGYTELTKAGGTLKLVGLTERVKTLMRMTNLDKIFEVHEDEARGLRSFA
jgi:anti-sigma B factor antagonist